LASQIQDLDVFLNEGWIRGDEVWEMATEFYHYVMRQIDRCIDNSHFRLWNLPALSSLRLKIEFFLIENYNGYEIRNANKPVNHQFNKIKEHSFYLFSQFHLLDHLTEEKHLKLLRETTILCMSLMNFLERNL
jgi:hypothetical protein